MSRMIRTGLENRTCTIYDADSPTGQCPKRWFCRGRCLQHYTALRRAEIEGRAAELQEQQVPPQRPKWEWPGDSEWLIARLEADENLLELKPKDEETDGTELPKGE